MKIIQKKWEMLQRIKTALDISADPSEVSFPNIFDNLSALDQHEILKSFSKKEKLFDIVKQTFKELPQSKKEIYTLKIYPKKFNKYYRKIESEYKNHANEIYLRKTNALPEFKDHSIKWGLKESLLSKDDNIYYLTRLIFSRTLGETIDADEAIDAVYGEDADKTSEDIRITVRSLNNKIASDLGVEKAIEFKGKSIRFKLEKFKSF